MSGENRYRYPTKSAACILKGSWCKNGRPKEIKLSQEKVREFAELKEFAISSDYNKSRDLKQEMNHLGNSIKNAGFNMHAVRHSEAQERYAELIAEGKPDREARQVVSNELGHGRIYVTKVYMGGMNVRLAGKNPLLPGFLSGLVRSFIRLPLDTHCGMIF